MSPIKPEKGNISSSEFVTLAIHTYRRALELQNKLKSEGLESQLKRVDSTTSIPEPGVRVCIRLNDLAKALKVVETAADRELAVISAQMAGVSPTLLIPIDFSEHSDLAVEVGFDLAKRLHLTPILLHAFVSPYFQGSIASTSPGEYENINMDDEEMQLTLSQQATIDMDRLKAKIRHRIAENTLPDLPFHAEVREGLPEEVILQFSRKTPPSFIVMVTRGASRRTRELIGSVTAEVLDSCRVPLFIVPENHDMPSISSINKVVFFCELDQQDILAMDTFQRMFNYPKDAEVYLVSVNERVLSLERKLESLASYFNDTFHESKFIPLPIKINSNVRSEFEMLMKKYQIELLIVPNRRRNIFQRLFNPSVAHRLLFEKDVPMLALPS